MKSLCLATLLILLPSAVAADDCEKDYKFTLPEKAIIQDCRQQWETREQRNWIYEARYRGLIAPFDEKKCIELGVIPKKWEGKEHVH